jgi:hypothetical protein
MFEENVLKFLKVFAFCFWIQTSFPKKKKKTSKAVGKITLMFVIVGGSFHRSYDAEWDRRDVRIVAYVR